MNLRQFVAITLFICCSILPVPGILSVKTYYVESYRSTNCSTIHPNSECHTLNEYLAQSSHYFTDFSTFHFLSGTHFANTSLSVSGVRNLSLIGHGKTKSIIECTNDSLGFVFLEVHNLLIQKLSISSCGRPSECYTKHNNNTRPALTLCSCSDISLSDMAIEMSNGQGFLAENITGIFEISCSNFSHSRGSRQYVGGNAIFYSGSTNSTLKIKDSGFFNNSNTAYNSSRMSTPSTPFAGGLLIVLKSTDIEVHMTNVWLSDNSGGSGGNLAIVIHHITQVTSKPVTLRHSSISNGIASVGGGLFLTVLETSVNSTELNACQNESRQSLGCPVVTIEDTEFINNRASYAGGAIYSRQKESFSFCSRGTIKIVGCTFEKNTLSSDGKGGVAIYSVYFILPEYVSFLKPQFNTEIINCTFKLNSAGQDWQYSSSGVVLAVENPNIMIANTTFESNDCSAVVAISSNVILSGFVEISNNRASSGAALFLCQNSKMFLNAHTNVTIVNNTAANVGGGIYADTECLDSQPACFFQLSIANNVSLLDTIRVNLLNNTARYAGNSVYGGSIEYCYMLENSFMNDTVNYEGNHTNLFTHLFNYTKNISSVTSSPHHVCFCDDNTVNCSKSVQKVPAYPGQSIGVNVTVVGQLEGLVPGLVIADVSHNRKITIGSLQNVQNIYETKCKELNFTIYSNHSHVSANISLYAQHHYDINILKHGKRFLSVNVTVEILKCPPGFEITTTLPFHCDCISLFSNSKIKCDITTQQIIRQPPLWIGYNKRHNTTQLLFHKHCPFDYCYQYQQRIDVKASNETPQLDQDAQCDFNRSGILCGGCSENRSIVLGTSNCKKCKNNSLFFLMIAAIAGILLVVMLTVLNLTVTEGTIHGLIFYANIVQINSSVFFFSSKSCWYTNALKIFIAWVNLDIGIEICLYDGMDEYAKAWLQFSFPLYILLLSGCIVYLCNKSTFIATLAGRNAVKVLATLVLLSYAKLLRALITSFSYIDLHTEHNGHINVWLNDGNLPYLHGKHIPLFMFSVLVGIICLPFTLTLLFIQQLEKYSHFRILFFIRKLKPFLDAYTGVYTNRGRCWPGLLLLARLLLFAVYAFNITGDPSVNFTAGVFTSILIIVLGWVVRPGIYKKWTLDVLEASFHLNLALLCLAASYFTQATDSERLNIATGISVSIVLLKFTGIIVYHSWKQCRNQQHIKKVLQRIKQRCVLGRSDNTSYMDDNDENWQQIPQPIHFDQDREPLLAHVGINK